MSTKIEWADKTWNPIVGCSHTSPGCDNCYAERMAVRQAHMEYAQLKKHLNQDPNAKNGLMKYAGTVDIITKKWNGKTIFVESALSKPMHWKTPRHIFVCSMSDLFHPSVPFEWIDKVMFTIYKSYYLGHTFQILTKHDERMCEYFARDIDARILDLFKQSDSNITSEHRLTNSVNLLPNVWFGVTVEHPDYKHRIDTLRKIPVAVRFISFEPLLADPGKVDLAGIGWVICGGESGPGARPMDPDWARGLRNQCKAAGVPFFFKQWGNPTAWNNQDEADREKAGIAGLDWSKTKGGRLLDGVEYNEMPEAGK